MRDACFKSTATSGTPNGPTYAPDHGVKPVLVTGATGTVGKEVVTALQALGREPRVATTNPAEAAPRFEAQGLAAGNVVKLEFGDPATYPAAFAGVEKVFLMRPPQIADIKNKMIPVLEVAQLQGVKHVVFMSLQGVEKNPVVPHRKVETYLKASGLTYTFLRPSFFMQNLSGIHATDVKTHGEIFVPAGRGRTSFVDARDIGAVAAKVLTERGYENKAYELTGAAALTYNEVAQIFSDVLGREVRYPNPSPLAFYRRMRSRGLERGFVLVMVALYTACRLGLAARVTGDTRDLLGREPRNVARFVEDYREAFVPG